MPKRSEIQSHLFELQEIFGKKLTFQDFQKLQEIEEEGHKAAEDYCNGILETEDFEKLERQLEREVGRITLANDGIIYLNSDPRGYFLKINDEYLRSKNIRMSHQDWGGYGIICPEELK